ncbi:NAD(P)/FAD-dependent oxidoreductase [Haladaptatus caseinilyticus]|uniref:NAD(P)/FAD-dependent oxidoreductase n=1 Tax=Haladaptatus caseinilyticus TaxID=2993314 RepID=UPI00224A7CBD|nr:FAD-dependent oxidoreductase [Haladaptatus caseinilyticus]
MTDDSYDVIVIGGGIIGCAIARDLASDYDVAVLERGQIAGEASALAAGEITMAPSYSDIPAISDHAIEFFRRYDGTGQFTFTECPSLELISPVREGESRRRVERLAAKGVNVSFVESERIETTYPRFDLPDFVGAIKYDDTGFVDPYTFAMTLKEDAESRGATFETGTMVTGLRTSGGRVQGVETTSGTCSAPTVVVAAGWRSERFLRDRLQLPIRPYRTQCVVLTPENDLRTDVPMGWIPGEHIYFRPERNGDLLVGGWSFAEDAPEHASTSDDEAFRNHVATLLPKFMHGFERARFVNGWAGIDGATPDTRPIIDAPNDGPAGLLVATGFHGRGVMSAPVAATTVRTLMTGGECPFPTGTFDLDRFESRSPDFEFRSISAGD